MDLLGVTGLIVGTVLVAMGFSLAKRFASHI
jgi:hypothetical protein